MTHQTNKTQRIEKKWGHETIIANNEKYCGKLLHFNQDTSTSIHKHLTKDETMYAIKGIAEIQIYDDEGKEIVEIIELTNHNNQTLQIKPNIWHKIHAVTKAIIMEASTTHTEEDTVRKIL